MKTNLQVIATFSKVTGDDGVEHYVGKISPMVFKRVKEEEIDVVLMPANGVPKSLANLMKKAGGSSADLLMFAGVGGSERQRREKT